MSDPAHNVEHVNPRIGKRIVAAAVMLADGRVVCGVRHFDELMIPNLPPNTPEGRKQLSGHVQGFVANDYQFYGREESWLIAMRAGQFDPKNATGTQGTLYSEDLW